MTTGWIEAPSDGTYTFDSSLQPSRLFINGTTVLDWFETSPGMTQRTHHAAGRSEVPPALGSPPGGAAVGDAGPGLTWQLPGAVGQVAIPSGNLYAIAPGGGTGLHGALRRR